MTAAFPEGFSEEDWEHTVGGRHFFIRQDGLIVSHAAVVARDIEAGNRMFRCGYVEGVATHPQVQRRGLGTLVMRSAAEHIREDYELGALGTDVFDFYERLGWERWQGSTFVRRPDGLFHSQEEDGYVMVMRFGPSADVDLTSDISCDPRSGDDW